MNLKEIKEIINLMNENDLVEIEIEREGAKIKIRKISSQLPHPYPSQPAEYRIETHPASPNSEQTPSSVSKTGTQTKEIVSPMVGTFYRAPSPEAPPFVEVGQAIEVGQVVCIIEAMKLMNEIKSEIKGKIIEVAVENVQPVEFGQTLFVVEPL